MVKAIRKRWVLITRNSHQREYIHRGGDILNIVFNGSSSYVQLIGKKSRRFIYGARGGNVSPSGAVRFANAYMKTN